MSSLPLSSLSLFPATPEQLVESRSRTYVSWGKGLTLQQYLERDGESDKHEVAKDHRLVTWVLAPRDSPESLDFMCSCETFKRRGLVSRKSDNAEGNNIVEEVNCYGIASVFTPERNRGKGYARHMMRLLHWVICGQGMRSKAKFPQEWGTPPEQPEYIDDGAFSVLYSDVGPKFYHQTGPSLDQGDGWDVADPISTLWNTDSAHSLLSAHKNSGDWRWLGEHTINDAWEIDAAMMKEEMSRESISQSAAFTFLPTRGVAEFQHLRNQLFWEKMDPKPTYWGICSRNEAPTTEDVSSLDLSVFASWTLDVRLPLNRLIITRLWVPLQKFEALMFQIIDFAKRHSVDEVEIWNLPYKFSDLAQSSGGKTFTRNDHLPSFKWYGNSKDVSWVHNEKFCWC